MINFSEVFEDNYQFYLNEISYKAITVGPISEKIDIYLRDEMAFEKPNDNSLKLVITRRVNFTPNVLYELFVSYGATLNFKDKSAIDSNIDWKKEFKENPVCIGLVQGLLSRISMQISQITSSYGQNPIVTPPNFANDI